MLSRKYFENKEQRNYMIDYDDINLLEALKILGISFYNILKDGLHFVRLNIDRIGLLFKQPKYSLRQKVNFWDDNKKYKIIRIYKDYKYCYILYELKGVSVNVSEGLIDFYNNKENNNV